MAVLLALFMSIANAGWQTGQLYVRDDNSKGPTAIYINSMGMDVRWPYPAHLWHTIEVDKIPSGEVPRDAKAILLHGIMIITQSNARVDCSLYFTFRVPGDTLPAEAYNSVMVVPSTVGGLRQMESVWVPVKDGKFEFYWARRTEGLWPDQCAYGLNMNVQGYMK